MSEAVRYLDGFLAAARPGNNRAGTKPPTATGRPGISPDASPASPPAPAPECSAEERIKRSLHPSDAFPRLLKCIEENCPPQSDDRFRFQWFGLFYQAPRQDAFHLRLRLPGGRLQAFQLVGLAEITQRFAAGCVLLNPSGGLDIPGVPLSASAEILRMIEDIGLSAARTGGDCVRSVRGGEQDGWHEDGAGAVYPLIRRLEQALAHHRRLADLPRGCEVAFLAANESLPADQDEAVDMLVVRLVDPASDGEARFLLTIVGGPTGGWRLPASRVVQGCVTLLETWAAGAERSRRDAAGLATYYLAHPHEKVATLLDQAEWQSMSPSPEINPARAGVTVPPGLPVPDGRLLSRQLQRIEQVLREQGLIGVRLIRRALHLAPEADTRTREKVRVVLGV